MRHPNVWTVSNIIGQDIRTDILPLSVTNYRISTSELSSGIYFANTSIGNSNTTKKLIVK